jgi:hypothetical protein
MKENKDFECKKPHEFYVESIVVGCKNCILHQDLKLPEKDMELVERILSDYL